MRPRLVVAVLVALSLLMVSCGASNDPALSAEDQVPSLGVALHRIDQSLASHRFAAARRQLRELKADVLEAREAGDLRAGDAQRVLDAIAELIRMLPAEDPRSTESPTPTAPATSTSPRPSGTASKRPEASKSSEPTPTTTSPTASPSSTSTTTSTPTPTPSTHATRGSSPTAVPGS